MGNQDWDVTLPLDHTLIGSVPSEIRALRSSAKSVILAEHVEPGTANAGGQHLKGAARVYLDSGLPSTDPESNNLDTTATTDDGRLSIDTSVATGSLLRVYIGTAAGISTGWNAIRVAYAGTAYEVVARTNIDAEGNSLVDIGNNAFITARKYGTPATAANLIKLNADDLIEFGDVAALVMTSTAPTADTHVSNKAYVDSQALALGAGASKSKDTNYSTTNGGIIVVLATITWTYNVAEFVTVLSDNNTTPITVVGKVGALCVRSDSANNAIYHALVIPIVAGKNYRVEDTGATAVINSITFYENA